MIQFILDDSGRWPLKGVFASISQRSKEPEKQYSSILTLMRMIQFLWFLDMYLLQIWVILIWVIHILLH